MQVQMKSLVKQLDQKDKKLENMDQTFRQEFANINA